MTDTIKAKQDFFSDGDWYLDMEDLLKNTNVKPSMVKYYSLKTLKNQSLVLTLYNAKKKKIKVKKTK
jgi:hypothetical protein